MEKPKKQNLEQLIKSLDKRIDDLKIQYNLFFSGEIILPPEKERSEIENQIRNFLFSEHKSAVINILIQNIASKFSIYNNVWLKRLHEVEIGIVPQKRKNLEDIELQKISNLNQKDLSVSLNNEDSFERFFYVYQALWSMSSTKILDKDRIINSLKAKMITANLINAEVNLTLNKGKVKIRLKK